jgi:L-arabinose isomerase
MPKLPGGQRPVETLPDLQTSAEAWILAGAAHHSVFTQAVDIEQLRTFADIMGIEFVVIDEHTLHPCARRAAALERGSLQDLPVTL